MQTNTRRNMIVIAGWQLAFPIAYFMLNNVFNEMRWSSLYAAAKPTLQYLGIPQFGWNINLSLLFGPVLALLLNGLLVLRIRLQFTKKTAAICPSLKAGGTWQSIL